MKKFLSNKTNLILIALFFIGIFIRNLYTNRLALNFMFDQARDLFVVKEIIGGDFKIQGLSANAPRLNHGVLFLYFLVPPYLLSNGNPIVASIWLSIFSSFSIIIVYYLALNMTKDKLTAILSAVFMTFSFEASQYALWLSNPAMGFWFVPLIYLCLWIWTVNKNIKFAFLTGLFLGFSIQSDLFLIYHAIPVAIWILLNKRGINIKQILIAIAGFLFGVSTLIISEIKFGFKGIEGLIYLFNGGDKIANSKSILDFALIYFNQISSVFSLNVFPSNLKVGSLVAVISVLSFLFLIKQKQKKNSINYKIFLLLYLFSHVSVVSLGGFNTPYLTVGIATAVCILVAIIISNIYHYKNPVMGFCEDGQSPKCVEPTTLWSWFLHKYNKLFAVLLVVGILLSNLNQIIKMNKFGQTIFAIRSNMLLPNLLEAVDYTYLSSGGEKFSINTVTAPLWLNTTWSALYNWHGLKNYNYLPYWHGRDQVGYWGDNLEKEEAGIKLHYLIIEPPGGIPYKYIQETINDEDYLSKIIEEKNFNGIVVQKRQKIR